MLQQFCWSLQQKEDLSPLCFKILCDVLKRNVKFTTLIKLSLRFVKPIFNEWEIENSLRRQWLCKTLNVYDTNLAFKKIYVAFDEIPKKMNWSNFLIYHHYIIKAWSAMHQMKLHQLRTRTHMTKRILMTKF